MFSTVTPNDDRTDDPRDKATDYDKGQYAEDLRGGRVNGDYLAFVD